MPTTPARGHAFAELRTLALTDGAAFITMSIVLDMESNWLARLGRQWHRPAVDRSDWRT
jgi:hypothetical protein